MQHSELIHFLFGRLSWDSIPYNVPILVYTFVAVALLGLSLVGTITWQLNVGFKNMEATGNTDLRDEDDNESDAVCSRPAILSQRIR